MRVGNRIGLVSIGSPQSATNFTRAIDRVVDAFNRGDPQPFNDAIDADGVIDKAFEDQLLNSAWKRHVVRGRGRR